MSDQSIDSRILFRLETDGCLKEPHSRSQRRSLTGQKIHWGEHERYLLLTVHASPMYLLSPLGAICAVHIIERAYVTEWPTCL